MGTKIQINSLAALERLIGGDTELEIELRKSVAMELVKKHIVAKLDLSSAPIRSLIRDQIDQAVKNFESYLKRPAIREIAGVTDPEVPMFRNTTILAEEAKRLYGEILREEALKRMPEIMKEVDSMVKDAIRDQIIEKLRKAAL